MITLRATAEPRVWRARTLSTPAAMLLALVALVALAGPASAHATLLSTNPANDALLETAPDQVTLTFDEAVSVWETSVSVFDPEGERLKVDARAVDATVVAVLPADLDEGSYTVSWRVISADDHPVSGGFTFSIGVRTQSVVPSEPKAATSLNLVRLTVDAVAYLGLLGTIGLGIFELLILDATPGAMPRTRRRLGLARRWLSSVAVVAFVAAPVLTTAWQQAGSIADVMNGVVWSDAVASHPAISTVLAVVGLLGVNVTVTRARASTVRSPSGYGAAAAALLAVTALPWVGHTRTYGPSWLVVAADLVHAFAAAIWLGCILGLLLMLWRGSDTSPRRSVSSVSRFSAVAGWTIVALAAAGIVLAWRVMGSVDDLWLTSYGRALLVKLGVVAAVLAVAGWNRRWLLPRLLRDPSADVVRRGLRRSLAAEAAGLVAVLGVTSVLVTQSPGVSGDVGSNASTGVARGIETDLGDGLARVRVSPLLPGRNVVQLYLRDGDGDPMRVIGKPSVRFTNDVEDLGPLPVELARVGPGQFEGTIDLPVAGRWEVDVSARTSTYEAPIATMTFDVG